MCDNSSFPEIINALNSSCGRYGIILAISSCIDGEIPLQMIDYSWKT